MQDMAYRAVSAGIGTLDDFLGSDHEHYASQPVSAGSGAGTINSVSAPVLVITIVGFPVGSEARIYAITTQTDIDFGTELVGVESSAGTTISYSGGTPGNFVMVQVLATGYKELLRPIEIPTVSQTIDISQDLELEDAFG